MKPPLAIISPLFPPARGGLADHTDLLAQNLGVDNDVTVITSRGEASDRPYKVCAEITQWQDAEALVAGIERMAPSGEILWQYVPHMYGRGGANPALATAMAVLKKRGRRQLLIAHEIAAPFSILPQRFLYAWAHRSQWRAIVPSMDFVGISTEAWIEPWSAYWPEERNKFQLLPSPSSLPIVAVPPDHGALWRKKHGLTVETRVMAHFGTNTTGKQFAWAVEAWRQNAGGDTPLALVVIGSGLPEAPKTDSGYLALGYLPPDEVSAALQAADVVALPFIDGVSERRTSAMAGLQHGRPVVTTSGHNTGPTLRGATFLLTTPVQHRAAFNDAVREALQNPSVQSRLTEGCSREYERAYSWAVVRERLDGALEKVRR